MSHDIVLSHTRAGQFETFLYQRGREAVLRSVKECWSSCFSERVMSHRLEVGMPLTGLKMGVVVQVRVHYNIPALCMCFVLYVFQPS